MKLPFLMKKPIQLGKFEENYRFYKKNSWNSQKRIKNYFKLHLFKELVYFCHPTKTKIVNLIIKS